MSDLADKNDPSQGFGESHPTSIELAALVQELSRRLNRHEMHKRRLDKTNVDASQGQGKLLLLLSESPGKSQKELALLLGMRPQSVSELIGKLAAKGLVKRMKSPDDARITLVSLTEEGAAAASRGFEATCETPSPFDALTQDERKSFDGIVRKLLAECDRIDSEALDTD